MAQLWTEKRVVISPDAEALAAGVAQRLLVRLAKRAEAGKTSHVLLSGGGIAGDVLRALGRHQDRTAIDWSTVHLWWGDEKFLPAGDDERNPCNTHFASFECIKDKPTATTYRYIDFWSISSRRRAQRMKPRSRCV